MIIDEIKKERDALQLSVDAFIDKYQNQLGLNIVIETIHDHDEDKLITVKIHVGL